MLTADLKDSGDPLDEENRLGTGASRLDAKKR